MASSVGASVDRADVDGEIPDGLRFTVIYGDGNSSAAVRICAGVKVKVPVWLGVR
jgi:hypothetical protein